MEPKKELVKGMLKQAAGVINEVIELPETEKNYSLYRYLYSVRGLLRIAITLVDEDYKEKEGR